MKQKQFLNLKVNNKIFIVISENKLTKYLNANPISIFFNNFILTKIIDEKQNLCKINIKIIYSQNSLKKKLTKRIISIKGS